MNGKQKFFELAANELIVALEKRNMRGFYVKTKEEALQKALGLIEKGSTVTWGGSETLKEIGFPEAIANGDYIVHDRATAKDRAEAAEIARKAFCADYYLASTNAITSDGELVNMDGSGNRVAALIYGPKQVILVVGMQKLVSDQASAIKRVRNTAAIMNTLRMERSSPCTSSGVCHDCTTTECICGHLVITRMSVEKNRINIILVGEEVGF